MADRRTLPLDEEPFLTDAGLETDLIFNRGIALPCFAAFPLLEHETGEEALRGYYEPFLALARARGVGFLLGSPTWRANTDWGAALGYDATGLAAANRRSVEFMLDLRDSTPAWGRPVLVEGVIGPRGDGYVASARMTSAQAEAYHAPQLEALAAGGADLASALTITYADEAIGIVRAAQRVGLPSAVSFTVETDGRLPSGQSLGEAVERVDEETDGAASYFMINCAHPSHFADALRDGGPWLSRIRGVRANASTRSHAELDEAEELDDGDPVDLAAQYAALGDALPQLHILGGCCGTDIRHVTAICDAWLEQRA